MRWNTSIVNCLWKDFGDGGRLVEHRTLVMRIEKLAPDDLVAGDGAVGDRRRPAEAWCDVGTTYDEAVHEVWRLAGNARTCGASQPKLSD